MSLSSWSLCQCLSLYLYNSLSRSFCFCLRLSRREPSSPPLWGGGGLGRRRGGWGGKEREGAAPDRRGPRRPALPRSPRAAPAPRPVRRGVSPPSSPPRSFGDPACPPGPPRPPPLRPPAVAGPAVFREVKSADVPFRAAGRFGGRARRLGSARGRRQGPPGYGATGRPRYLLPGHLDAWAGFRRPEGPRRDGEAFAGDARGRGLGRRGAPRRPEQQGDLGDAPPTLDGRQGPGGVPDRAGLREMMGPLTGGSQARPTLGVSRIPVVSVLRLELRVWPQRGPWTPCSPIFGSKVPISIL